MQHLLSYRHWSEILFITLINFLWDFFCVFLLGNWMYHTRNKVEWGPMLNSLSKRQPHHLVSQNSTRIEASPVSEFLIIWKTGMPKWRWNLVEVLWLYPIVFNCSRTKFEAIIVNVCPFLFKIFAWSFALLLANILWLHEWIIHTLVRHFGPF